MKNEGHSDQLKGESLCNIIGILKACTAQKNLGKGAYLHSYVQEHKLLEKNAYIGSTVVNMYAKCGALAKAREVLEELPVRNVVTWSALIAGYAEHGQGEEALKCFNDMLCEGHSPDTVAFICVLKACGSIRAAAKGKEIHDKIHRLGMLKKDIVLGNTLVDMYVKCGALAEAQQVLQELPLRSVITWSALIAGYAQQGQGEKALKCFNDMLDEGHSPNVVTFICALKACGSIRAPAKGKEIHDKIVSLGMLEKEIVIGNALVDMYAKCGVLGRAQQVLEGLPIRNGISWNAIITGYAQQGQGEEALKCFDDMLNEGHSPDVVTFTCALKACGAIKAAAKGEEIHGKIVNLGILGKDVVLGSTLVDMYAKCGALVKAQQVLGELPIRNVVTWNALIVGYAQQGQGEQALKCFDDMLCEGHSPDAVTFICALKACASIGTAAKGKEIHDKIVSLGMLENDIVLGSTLVDMYAKCGVLAKAEQVFKELPVQTVITWNSLIAGYAQQGQGEEVLKCFNDMLCEGHCADVVTYICVLKACGSTRALVKGKEIHGKIVNLGILDKDIVLGNTLEDMYVKCGALARAQQVLEELPIRNVVSWNALIVGYAQQGQGEQALKSFNDMLQEGHSPDMITFIGILKACGSIGAATKGEEIHDRIVSLDMLEKDVVLGNTLVNLYARCGALSKAQEVLEELAVSDVVTWNALIFGYAQQGQSLETIHCFEKMQSKGVKPNSITLNSVLNVCSHSGLLDKAESYFSQMTVKYGIYPDLEHYCCMIDLFGRAGKLNKALFMIAEMPFDNCLPNWLTLLGACRKWGAVEIGILAFEHTLHVDKSNAAVYSLMADIYLAAGMQAETDRLEAIGFAKAWKILECCWQADAIGKLHSF